MYINNYFKKYGQWLSYSPDPMTNLETDQDFSGISLLSAIVSTYRGC